MRNGIAQIGDRLLFEFEIAGDDLFGVLADQQLVEILQIGQSAEEQDPLHQRIGVLHLVDGFFVFFFDSSEMPQLASIRECRKY